MRSRLESNESSNAELTWSPSQWSAASFEQAEKSFVSTIAK
jgi:hypothetical protein